MWKAVTTVDSGHCRLCDRCVYRRDHHCLFLNRCVAADTRRLFVAFLLAAVALIDSFEYVSVVYLRRRHQAAGGELPPLDWRLMADVFVDDVPVWPICVLDALAGCLLTAVTVHHLLKISEESSSRLTILQRLRNVLDFAMGRGLHAVDQTPCHRSQPDCVV